MSKVTRAKLPKKLRAVANPKTCYQGYHAIPLWRLDMFDFQTTARGG